MVLYVTDNSCFSRCSAPFTYGLMQLLRLPERYIINEAGHFKTANILLYPEVTLVRRCRSLDE